MHLRDAVMTAAVLGFFAAAWFGWAQEDPPKAWRIPLSVGSIASLAVSVAAGVVAWREWGSGSVLDDDGTFRTYLIIVGVEFGVAAVGAALLVLLRLSRYLAPWICLVVGVHFYPMAPVLQSTRLYVLATVLTAVAVAAPLLARRAKLLPSTVTGAAAGVTLLVFTVLSAGSALFLLAA